MRKYFFGIYKYIIKPYALFSNVKINTKYYGIVLQLNLNDWIAQNIYFLRNYEKKELAYVCGQLKSTSVFIDIGANIGLYTLTAAQICKEGHVYAFEPFYENNKQLLFNLKKNKLKVHCIEKAVSNHNNGLQLHYDNSELNLGTVSIINSGGQSHKVASITLDDFVALQKIERIDLIKIDIEGGEWDALLGMHEVLTHFAPTLLIEIDNEILLKMKHTSADIYKLLQSYNYQPSYFQNNGLLTSNSAFAASKNVVFIKS